MSSSSSAPTHQQVLWFDVSVHNVEAVEVFDSAGQIVQHAAGVPLRVSVGRRDGVEKISSLRKSITGQGRGTSVRAVVEGVGLFHPPSLKETL